ncbi:UPF0669 protein C6orf120 homolog [Pieris napi]|uniref:UPF0669 protein C6orf120 homolog n=1 Tax=Pieris napi TaxID=78633 RepID=UPI001FB98FC7|nr:UPF0669 protein C6orf120 homolog [Pieris napi]
MIREIIFALLAIITASSMWSLLSNVFHMAFIDNMLLDTVIGVVGAGNFSYWQLGHSGPLRVELTSLSGDADLYVADNLRPSYEFGKHNFSSISFGVDIVKIPADFPRPIGIGVYGHGAHPVSTYSINVFLDDGDANEIRFNKVKIESTVSKPKGKITTERVEEKPRFLKFLNFLDMVFDTFVL